MRSSAKYLVNEELYRRKRCNWWHCREKATHYLMRPARRYDSRLRAFGVYCMEHAKSWLGKNEVMRQRALVDREVDASLP